MTDIDEQAFSPRDPDKAIPDPDLEPVKPALDYGPHDTSPWPESPDNPYSPAFQPLSRRGPAGKARWWARSAKRVRVTGSRPITEY